MFTLEARLEEVLLMLHISSPDANLEADRCARSNEHCDYALTTRRFGWAATIHGYRASDDHGHSLILSERIILIGEPITSSSYEKSKLTCKSFLLAVSLLEAKVALMNSYKALVIS